MLYENVDKCTLSNASGETLIREGARGDVGGGQQVDTRPFICSPCISAKASIK